MEPVNGSLNVWQMIQQGWVACYPLIAMSVISFTIIGERLWALRGIVSSTARLTRTVYADVSKGDLRAGAQHAEAGQRKPSA